ncbi:KH domain [Carpediemonas membranifera]|uniref:Branchpoint-bridging protein n=1 Tax=Carpediemonas membranifera TaxID=201153 RepID=A0A8J6E155_9EUKA|nr:KH domain [Carpediemonas membranifera]|eukprot:KAG9393038.1 KH domain [Carpediemonas membranifera]
MAFPSFASEAPFEFTDFSKPKFSRWTDVEDDFYTSQKEVVPGFKIGSEIPPNLPAGLSEYELRAIEATVRVHDIAQKLENGVITSYDEEAAVLDDLLKNSMQGTARGSEALTNWMHETIEQAMTTNHLFFVPSNRINRPDKIRTKVMLGSVQAQHPDMNYSGQIIGPKGATLKAMEAESGTKISVRGQGASNDGAGRAETDEELHVAIEGDTIIQVLRARRMIWEVIEDPELKQAQLRMLAAMNGTKNFLACRFCGGQHNSEDCRYAPSVTKDVVLKEEVDADKDLDAFLDDIDGVGDVVAHPWLAEAAETAPPEAPPPPPADDFMPPMPGL